MVPLCSDRDNRAYPCGAALADVIARASPVFRAPGPELIPLPSRADRDPSRSYSAHDRSSLLDLTCKMQPKGAGQSLARLRLDPEVPTDQPPVMGADCPTECTSVTICHTGIIVRPRAAAAIARQCRARR